MFTVRSSKVSKKLYERKYQTLWPRKRELQDRGPGMLKMGDLNYISTPSRNFLTKLNNENLSHNSPRYLLKQVKVRKER